MDWHFLDPNPDGERPVLFLHGLGADAASWSYQLEALAAAGIRPLAVDLPGFGSTPYDGRGWTLERMAALLAAWLDDQALPQVDLVGLSLGGVVAQEFALTYPQRVRKLVLMNTFAVLRPDSWRTALYFLARFLVVTFVGLEKQAELVAGKIFPAPEQRAQYEALVQTISQADPRAYRAAMRALARHDARQRLGQLPMPTLVMTGAEDTTIHPRHQRLLADSIPGARQVVIPGAGHGMIVEAPQACNRHLLAFLSE